MYIQKRKITAADEVDVDTMDTGAEVAPEAADLLFEAEDVAELVAEVTGQPVEVSAEDEGNAVTFTVGDDEFTVEAEGDEEILESVRRTFRGKRPVSASTKRQPAKQSRVIRKLPSIKASSDSKKR